MLNRELLFARLDKLAYQTVLDATSACRRARHAYVGLEHWLHAMLAYEKSDIRLLLAHYDASPAAVMRDIEKSMSRLPKHTVALQDLSPQLENAVERGLVISQMLRPASLIRTSDVLFGMLQTPELQRSLYQISGAFEKIPLAQAIKDASRILAASDESMVSEQPHDALSRGDLFDSENPGESAPDALEKWCVDLTEQARNNHIDPVIGRETELRQVIDIVLRRRQNNPILVGEAGVGKTAVVEAFARRIASGDVPPPLRNARLLSLDLSRMLAGAGVRGEFEARLKTLVDAIIASQASQPVILFCDEAHTLIGAGVQAGTGDAGNLLKPMLARGALRMIGATTWSEYKQFIEPDAALTRRFQIVVIGEPAEDSACDMLRAIAPHFASHHQVVIRDGAIQAAVRMSARHLPSRQLPDKAISLLDTACARVAQSQHTLPLELELIQAKIRTLQLERDALQAEARFGAVMGEQLQLLRQDITAHESTLDALQLRLQSERRLTADLLDTELKLEPQTAPVDAGKQPAPLVHSWVDEHVIAEVLSGWTGIPAGKMLLDDIDNVLALDSLLGQRLFGQQAAVGILAQALRVSRSGLAPPNQPLGVFMLTGPTGTGKTEMAQVLADLLYGGEHNLLSFNMTEFQEAHTASTLKGAPPGYVGYGKGGKLTEAIRRKPYSVILLDEFDKAHRDVHALFYQVFDKGWMEDGEGRQVSFSQCLILLTSNLGERQIAEAVGADPAMPYAQLHALAKEALLNRFPPALLARMQIIPFVPLSAAALESIASHHLHELEQRLLRDVNIALLAETGVAAWIAGQVSSQAQSGRAIKEFVTRAILPQISTQLLQCQKQDKQLRSVHLACENNQISIAFSH